MLTAYAPIADGDSGVKDILTRLNSLKDYFGSLPCIRAAALTISDPGEDNDNLGNAKKLAAFVRSAVCYVCDPVNSELTQTPDVMLLEIHCRGRVAGDCDDHVLLFASLCESLGIPAEIVGVQTPDSTRFDHVIVIVWLDDQPVQFDLCAKHGEAPVYDSVLR